MGSEQVVTYEASAKHVGIYTFLREGEAPVLLIQGSIGAGWHDMDLRISFTPDAIAELVDILLPYIQD